MNSKQQNGPKFTVTLGAGFEPERGDPIGFQVRLNHSAITVAWVKSYVFNFFSELILIFSIDTSPFRLFLRVFYFNLNKMIKDFFLSFVFLNIIKEYLEIVGVN